MSMTLAHLLPDQALPPQVAALAVSELRLDSRRLQEGDLFLALPGVHADGRDYIEQAVRAGAAAVLADAESEDLNEVDGVPVIGVPHLRRRAGEVAGRFFGEPARDMLVAAVTGTNGKTSVAWFLRDAFNALGRECALLGTLGALFRGEHYDTGHTTPDVITLHRHLADFRAAGAVAVVMEASSHALDQDRLSGVPVTVAVFTNLSHEHLDYHGDMDSYFRAKARLFTRPEVQLAVINAGDSRFHELASLLADGVQSVSFGADARVRCLGFSPGPDGMGLELDVAGEVLSVQVPLYGRFNMENLLAVAAVLSGLDMGPAEIERALSAVSPVPGRMQPVTGGAHQPGVLVDYAHTPDALEKSLEAVRAHFSGRVICVVGCGGDRDRQKRPQMAAVAERLADRVVLTADNPRSEAVEDILEAMLAGIQDRADIAVVADRADAVRQAVAMAGADDVVLVAGKGHETWQEINGRKLPMDDRELAAAALRDAGGDQ
jgi:UDP-N-acetylmuramoyl-L-alanyl-D-glutamate--2,6-diaminopimelate ligase